MTRSETAPSPADPLLQQSEAMRTAIDASGGSTVVSTKVHKDFTNKKVNIVLDEYNFLMWKQQVLLAVRSLRLEKLLTGVLKAPPATVTSADGVVTENEDYEIFVAQDSALASWILSTISPQLLPQFISAETTSEIWSTVLRFFSSRSTTTMMSLHYKLRSLKKGDLSMRTYVSQVKELCNALAACGSPIFDLETIATILNGLSMEYQPFVAIITVSRDPFTLDAAISVLFDAETQLNNFSPISELSPSLHVVQSSVGNNYVAPSGGSSSARPYRVSNAQGGRGRNGRMRLQCQLCGKLGHLVDRCWHQFDETFVPVTARSRDQAKSEPSSVNLCAFDTNSPGVVCSCAASKNQAVAAESRTSVQPQAHLATTAKGQWFVNSGASHHVSPDSSILVDSADYSGPGKLTVGNGMHLGISRIGQSSLISSSSTRTLLLNNVLHVPNITKNLVSVSKLARDNKLFLEFHPCSCVVRDGDTGDVLLTGDQVGGLYRFNSHLPMSLCNKKHVEANMLHKSSVFEACNSRPTRACCTEPLTIPVVPGAERLWRCTRTTPVETRLHESPDVGSSSAIAGLNVDSSVGVDSTCQAPVSSPESNASHSSPTSLRSPTPMLDKSLQESRICLPDYNNDIVHSANVEPSCGNAPESSIARENLEVVVRKLFNELSISCMGVNDVTPACSGYKTHAEVGNSLRKLNKQKSQL
ncbi:hypothetical protein GQ457_08G024740 [Hibiscus cannabinus]